MIGDNYLCADMNIRFLIPILMYAAFAASPGWADPTDGSAIPEYSKAYDPGRDPFADGEEARKYARQTNRRGLIQVGGDWCGYCRALDRFIDSNDTVRKSLYRQFVVLKVNVSDENDNQAFMSAMPKTFGYPHIFIAESSGNVVFSDDTARLLHDGEYAEERFIEFLDKWGPPTDS